MQTAKRKKKSPIRSRTGRKRNCISADRQASRFHSGVRPVLYSFVLQYGGVHCHGWVGLVSSLALILVVCMCVCVPVIFPIGGQGTGGEQLEVRRSGGRLVMYCRIPCGCLFQSANLQPQRSNDGLLPAGSRTMFGVVQLELKREEVCGAPPHMHTHTYTRTHTHKYTVGRQECGKRPMYKP